MLHSAAELRRKKKLERPCLSYLGRNKADARVEYMNDELEDQTISALVAKNAESIKWVGALKVDCV